MKITVFDKTGTRAVPGTAAFEAGAKLTAASVRAAALQALSFLDSPEIVVEVLGPDKAPTSKISASCVIVVRRKTSLDDIFNMFPKEKGNLFDDFFQ